MYGNPLRKVLTTAIVLVVGLTSAAHADTITYNADFSTGTLDPSLIASANSPFSIVSGGGNLVISKGATNTPTGGGPVGPSVFTDFSLTGNFTINATVDVSGLTPFGPNAVNLGLIGAANNSGSTSILLASNSLVISGDFVNGNYVPGPAPTASSTFEVQIQRVGDTITQSYANFGQPTFTQLFTITDPSFSGPYVALLGLNLSADTTSAESITFSNFSVTYDTGVPTPGAFAILSLGLLGISGMRRKSKAA